MNDSPTSARAFKANLLPTVLIIAILYFGREFFIPLALATLLAFLLVTPICYLEKLRLGRVTAVLIAVLLALSVVGGVAYVVGGQLLSLARDLPNYKGTLQEKVEELQVPKDGALAKAKETLQELSKEITAGGTERVPQGGPKFRTVGKQETPGGIEAKLKLNQPLPVTVISMPDSPDQVNPAGSALQTLRNFVSPVLQPLGTAFLVVIFAIFILVDREDLRDRIIHLLGRGHLQMTTEALDDAGGRVSRYLLAQSSVNLCFGVPIGIGLYFIGVPNAFLWGLLATILRFIPYLGIWMAFACPFLLSLAVAHSWTPPLLTLLLFVGVELTTANVIEPRLYGSSTGLSSMAVITAAAFWTWVWGPVGLLLSTPLTVCLAVLGKYLPGLTFLDVLLGDKPPIAAEDRFYQRLLAGDEEEVTRIAIEHCGKHTYPVTMETLVIPALRVADCDYHAGTLAEPSRSRIYTLVSDLLTDLKECLPAHGEADMNGPATVFCVPANDLGDELAARMLAQMLAASGVRAQVTGAKLLASELVELAAGAEAPRFCVSVLPPASTRQGVYVCKRLRERFPAARLIVGMWGEPASDERGRLKRYEKVVIDGIFTSLQEAAKDLLATTTTTVQGNNEKKDAAAMAPPKEAASEPALRK